MKKFRLLIITIIILCFSFTTYGSTMKPTEESMFLNSFLTQLYTFNNDDLQNLYFYKFMYPYDKFTLKLRNYMTEKTFDNFSKKKLYYDFITGAYYNGFSSSVYYINLKSVSKNITDSTYTFEATVELFINHKNKKEIYKINGELSLSKINDKYKITNLSKIVFPTIGNSNVVSKLV